MRTQTELQLPSTPETEHFTPSEAVTVLDALAVALRNADALLCCAGNTAEEMRTATSGADYSFARKADELTAAATDLVREAREKVVMAAACFSRLAAERKDAA